MVMPMVWPTTATRRRLLFLLYATAGCLLLYHGVGVAADAATPVSFRFINFFNMPTDRLQDLRFEGDALLQGGLVNLTACSSSSSSARQQSISRSNCTGRVSYDRPVQFYDSSTGEVASFSTRFTFAIVRPGNGDGDKASGGMAFFLSSYPSRLPPDSGAGNLGLDDGMTATAYGVDRFLAVEFDTYGDDWDPKGAKDHVGIDISSTRSSANAISLPSSSLNGNMTASITFNSSTMMLVASLEFHDRPYLGPVEVSMEFIDPTSLLPPEVVVGFSAAAGMSSDLHQIMSWSFNSTLPITQPRGKEGEQALGEEGNSIDAGAIIGVAVVSVSVAVVWFILSCFMWKRAGSSFVKRAGLGEFRRFRYRELLEATGKFSPENKLGEGAFGVVHRGVLKKHDGQQDEVAVKQIKGSALRETNAFLDELKTTSQTSHKNLVRLKGWCCSRIKYWKLLDFMCCRQQLDADLFLVYELVPNGSLHNHLNKDKPGQAVLPWATRYEIVKGIGSALLYLHHECIPYILHRDIKPCNILLDAEFNPKLADFGLSRIADSNNIIHPTVAIGTEGYIDPLCRKDGKVMFRRASDVYSFGVVLLDITCPQKTMDQVREMYRRSGPEKFFEDAADVQLCGQFDRMQMKQVAVLGLWCCFPDDAQRPSMQEAMKVLENDVPLLKRGIWILEHGTGLPDEQMIQEDGGSYASFMTIPDGQPLIPASVYTRSS